MRRRTSASLVLALVALLALASVGMGAKGFPTRYGGRTSQGQAMSLVVGPSGRAVTIDMRYAFTCPAAQVTIPTGDKWRTYLATTRKFHDAWSSDQPVDIPDSVLFGAGDLKATFKGTASGLLGRTAATGRYTEHLTMFDGTGQVVQECDTGAVTFRLKPTK